MSTALSSPLSFTRGPAMPNRMMLAPLTNGQSAEDGTLGDDEFNWLIKRAQGGLGLTMTCAAHVQENGRAFLGQLGIWNDAQILGLTRLADAIRAAGSLSSVQLHHGGQRCGDLKLNAGDIVAPYADPELGSRAMTTEEVEETIAAFASAAARAEKAGFDGVEIHGAHGYLLGQFLYADKNQRTDRFGGSYDNRVRIYWEVIDAIRANTNPDFQVGLRLSPKRYGMELAESTQFARELMTSGKIDYLDMSLWDCFKDPAEAEFNGRPLIDFFTGLERGNCRLGVAGKIMNAATAQKCLDHGADFVMIGRGAMLHHDFASRAIADPAFAAVPFPVTRAYFRNEGLGDAFIDYVASTWPSYVAD